MSDTLVCYFSRATSGFGVKFAKVLSDEGANVFIGGRREHKGKEVAKETISTFHPVDVANEESNRRFFKAAEDHFGGQNVDYILLNAGVEGNNEATMIEKLDVGTYDFIFGINVRGIVLGMEYGAPLLRKGGTFVCTSSSASILPFGGNPVYAASKSAVDGLVRCYAAQFTESQDERIKSLSIVSVNPTLYATDLSDRFVGGSSEALEGFAKAVNPSKRVGNADELAGIVLDFVKGNLEYPSGTSFVADADTHFPLNDYFSRLSADPVEVEL